MSIVCCSVVLVLLHQVRYINASVEWPEGFYGLLKPETGCPEEWTRKEWEQNCSINQDTVNHRPDNEKSEALHIDGDVNPSNVERYFCLKTKWYGRTTWPEGQYCVYSQFGRQGMQWGSIRMYNEWYDNQDSVSASCRDFFHGKGTKHIDLHFACQTSGNKKIPISLPITQPFYLLPYGSPACQQVQWMVATSEWIKYHTRNYDGRYYKQKRVPYHTLGTKWDRGIKMYYCYYESCNYTLNDTSGVFQSPGFPGQYPAGQLCSWRIMVPDNHTLRVHFTNFSLHDSDKDSLELYENNSRVFRLKQAFFGHQRPFNTTASTDLVFVFKSDEKNSSYGFRAEYTIIDFKHERTTAAPKSTTKLITTKQPTTNQPTTTATETTNEGLPANETLHCNITKCKTESCDKQTIHQLQEKTCFCDETWKTVVMVIPLAVSILISLVIIDIFCRCRSKRSIGNNANGSSADDGMVVNPIYERGNIMLDSPADSRDGSTENTLDVHPHSRNEPHDYEDVEGTQLNVVPPPTRSSKRLDYRPLVSICADTSAVSNHVLEPPKTESNGPQCHAAEPNRSGPREVLGHLTKLIRPVYQNRSEVNHYILNPIYEPAENSSGEANKPWDNYFA